MVRLRFCLALLVAVHGWWPSGNASEAAATPEVGPWQEAARKRFPALEGQWTKLEEGMQQAFTWATAGAGGQSQPFETGLWMVVDTIVGLVGWALFGAAWTNVRTGCKRVMQIALVLGLCLVAHYVWAVCYPVVSVVVAVAMAVIWICRKVLKLVGAWMFWLQRVTGGSPEAAEAEFHGPVRVALRRPRS